MLFPVSKTAPPPKQIPGYAPAYVEDKDNQIIEIFVCYF